jgi:hypothetical protein
MSLMAYRPSGTERDLTDQLEALKRLNRRRFDYVLIRSRTDSIEATLAEMGVTKGWYYQFTLEERVELERLADELHYEQGVAALYALIDNSRKAAQVLAASLDSISEKVRLDAARDILDRVLGKAKQPVENEMGGSVTINVEYGDGHDRPDE